MTQAVALCLSVGRQPQISSPPQNKDGCPKTLGASFNKIKELYHLTSRHMEIMT